MSRADVEQARGYLGTRRGSKWNQLIGTIGAAILGAAVSTALPLTNGQTITPELVQLTVIATVVGTAMTIVGYMRNS